MPVSASKVRFAQRLVDVVTALWRDVLALVLLAAGLALPWVAWGDALGELSPAALLPAAAQLSVPGFSAVDVGPFARGLHVLPVLVATCVTGFGVLLAALYRVLRRRPCPWPLVLLRTLCALPLIGVVAWAVGVSVVPVFAGHFERAGALVGVGEAASLAGALFAAVPRPADAVGAAGMRWRPRLARLWFGLFALVFTLQAAAGVAGNWLAMQPVVLAAAPATTAEATFATLLLASPAWMVQLALAVVICGVLLRSAAARAMGVAFGACAVAALPLGWLAVRGISVAQLPAELVEGATSAAGIGTLAEHVLLAQWRGLGAGESLPTTAGFPLLVACALLPLLTHPGFSAVMLKSRVPRLAALRLAVSCAGWAAAGVGVLAVGALLCGPAVAVAVGNLISGVQSGRLGEGVVELPGGTAAHALLPWLCAAVLVAAVCLRVLLRTPKFPHGEIPGGVLGSAHPLFLLRPAAIVAVVCTVLAGLATLVCAVLAASGTVAAALLPPAWWMLPLLGSPVALLVQSYCARLWPVWFPQFVSLVDDPAAPAPGGGQPGGGKPPVEDAIAQAAALAR